MAKKKNPKGAGRKMFDGKDIEKVIAKLEESFSCSFTDAEACLDADISLDQLYNYCRKNPDFSIKKEILKRTPNMMAKRNIKDDLKVGEASTSKWLLEHKAGDEYSKQTKTDITTKGEKVETVVNISSLSDLEIDDALQAKLSENTKGE